MRIGVQTGVEIGAEIAVWWLIGFGIWTATLSSASAAELTIGVVASGLSAVLARVARSAMGGQPGLRLRMWLRWLRWAALVPAAAVADLVRLVGWLGAGRPEPAAAQRVVVVRVPSGDRPTAITWRQGAALAISSTPGSVVTGIDTRGGKLVLDQLVSGWPDLDRQVSE